MTHYTKRFLIYTATIVTLLGGTVGIASAKMGGIGPATDQFAQAFATHFNLDVNLVKAFIKEQATTEVTTRVDTRLTKAVTDGKITEAQKQLIITEQGVITARLATIKAITDPTAKKSAMKTLQADVTAWATANNIPKGMMIGFAEGIGNMRKGPEGHGKK